MARLLTRRGLLHSAATIGAASLVGTASAIAQTSYPEKPVRLLYGFPAGTDTLVRVLADRLSEAWKQPVIVENITGASGNIATDRTAKAAADGYTIGVLGSGSVAINVNLFKRLSFDPAKDLIPITKLYEFPQLLAVNNDVPATSVAELIALAKAQPGRLTAAHGGLGTTTHLAIEILKFAAQIDVQQVPYRGVPLQDLITGRISMVVYPPGLLHPFAQEGKIRLLATTSPNRWPYTPDVPTIRELGFPGLEMMGWFGLFVPAGTPDAIVQKIHRDTAKAVESPQMRKRLEDVKTMSAVNAPAEFAEEIKSETAFWARVIKDTGVQRIE